MSLMRFRYLRRQRVLTLALILTLTSALFSITAFSFLSFYNGFTTYIGEEEEIAAIYGRESRTPFSSLVPVYLAERLSSINGVVASSPEVITPVVIRGESVFVRGIIPEEFCKLNALTAVEGDMLDTEDLNFALVGKRLSEKLGIEVGDKVFVFSVLREKYVELQVKGVYESQSPMDDEALVPLYVGQWLRGASYNDVTIIRVKIDKDRASPNMLFDVLAEEASQQSTSEEEGEKPYEEIIPFVKRGFTLEDVGVEEPEDFMQNYLVRYGITKETLIVLSVMVLILASATVFCALTVFVNQHRPEIGIIRSLGASARKMKLDLLAKVLSWSLISSALGIFLAAAVLVVFERIGYLQVLSHRISFQFDPLLFVVNFAFTSMLVVVGIGRASVKE